MIMLFSGYASAHQFLPTYPKFQPSFVAGVSHVNMELFNKRKDAEYYELGVFDTNWNPISFASASKIFQVKHLETKKIIVYVRNEDLVKVVFICTESKLRREETKQPLISSKICSKIK